MTEALSPIGDLLDYIHAAHQVGYDAGFAAGQMVASVDLVHQLLHRPAAQVASWVVSDLNREGLAQRDERRRSEQRAAGDPLAWVTDPQRRESVRQELSQSFWAIEDAAIASGQGQLHPWLHRGFATEAGMRRYDAEKAIGRAA